MKFTKVADAFNFYRMKDIAELEKRAKEINNDIDTNPNVDIEAYNIELRGIKEAKENIELRSQATNAGLNLVTGRSFEKEEAKEFRADNVVDTPEYRNAFYKTLLGHELSEIEQRAFNAAMEKRKEFDTAADIAAAIPTHTLNEVIKKARTMGGLLAEARAFNMPSKITIPVGTPHTRANWHVEGTPVATEKVEIAPISFDGYEIIKIFSISAKARRMSITAFESYLVDELTACVMETIEDAMVNGTGVEQGTGLETGVTWTAGENLVEVVDAVEYADVVKTVGTLKRGYSKGAKWAMNNATLYNLFYGMVDTTGRPIFIQDPRTDSIGKLLGFDVVVDDNIADNVAYLGNYNKYLGYNLPQGITIEVSTDSGFRSGLIDYRALAIADTKPIVGEAFVKLAVSAGE